MTDARSSRSLLPRLEAAADRKRSITFVTGATDSGTFVRVVQPHIEGMLVQVEQGLDVGDKLRVKLIRADAQKGYIDFARA